MENDGKTMKPWKIRMLGDLSAERGGRVVRSFGTQKAALLLAYVACNPGRRHSREELAELLWPDSDYNAARTNLRVALHALRQRLELGGCETDSLFLSDKSNIQLDPSRYFTDVAAFELACDEALSPTPGVDVF